MKIAVLQMNSIVGDFNANAEKIIQAAIDAKKNHADILITPKMALTGYPIDDLLLRSSFFPKMQQALDLLKTVQDITLIVGHPIQLGSDYFNGCSVFNDESILSYQQINLSHDSILNERHYFKAGTQPCILEKKGKKIAIMIGDDITDNHLNQTLKNQNTDCVIILDSSPFYLHKQQEYLQTITQKAMTTQQAYLYVNAVGGQDELVFDGCSFAYNPQKTITFKAPAFQESLSYVHLDEKNQFQGSISTQPQSDEEWLFQAISRGIKDYVQKSGFKKLCLGLSGGIDSALVLAIAVDAVGCENCEVLLMPSQYTSQLSNTAAQKMAENLNVQHEIMPISNIFQSFTNTLSQRFSGLVEDITEENLQARIRGSLLMALSNKTNALLLNTGNKSELAMGYCTLYGDTNGGYAPLKDLYKTQVYALSKWINQSKNQEIIPNEIITRAPSAELRANQTDQDSLPDYEILDQILNLLIEQNISSINLIQQGYNQEIIKQITHLLKISEYKRRQGAPGPKLSKKGFGREWHQPICHQFLLF